MRRHGGTALATIAVTGLVAVLGLGACKSDKKVGKGGEKVAVTATDSECLVDRTQLAAGRYTFAVTNEGTKPNGFTVSRSGKVAGQVNKIGPGQTRDVNVDLSVGEYDGACRPDSAEPVPVKLIVVPKGSGLVDDPKVVAGIDAYKQYLASEAESLVVRTSEFADAVKAGDVAKAKAAYPQARTHWSHLSPVVLYFGDLNVAIDAQENQVEPGAEWTGFHRLEKALWATGAVGAPEGELADRLRADVTTLQDQARNLEISLLDVATGAKNALDEASTTMITGEAEQYSHTDLWDIAGVVEGSKAAINALREPVGKADAALLSTLDKKFADVEALLAKQKSGDGYKPYNEVPKADITALGDALGSLAEEVGRIGALVEHG